MFQLEVSLLDSLLRTNDESEAQIRSHFVLVDVCEWGTVGGKILESCSTNSS